MASLCLPFYSEFIIAQSPSFFNFNFHFLYNKKRSPAKAQRSFLLLLDLCNGRDMSVAGIDVRQDALTVKMRHRIGSIGRERDLVAGSFQLLAADHRPEHADHTAVAGNQHGLSLVFPCDSLHGTQKALAALGADASRAAMLGDQLFTDAYAGKRMGMRALIVPPIKDKTTLFFRFKRALEKPIMKSYLKEKAKLEGKK